LPSEFTVELQVRQRHMIGQYEMRALIVDNDSAKLSFMVLVWEVNYISLFWLVFEVAKWVFDPNIDAQRCRECHNSVEASEYRTASSKPGVSIRKIIDGLLAVMLLKRVGFNVVGLLLRASKAWLKVVSSRVRCSMTQLFPVPSPLRSAVTTSTEYWNQRRHWYWQSYRKLRSQQGL